MTQLQKALSAIDEFNTQDPNKIDFEGNSIAKEVLYAQRMTEHLLAYDQDASESLQIAARAQHIGRWKISRDQYPMDRVGYLKWRTELKELHADLTAEILTSLDYSPESIHQVSQLIKKVQFKNKADAQKLEDVVCFVFLQYYFEDFAQKHPEEKVLQIVQKTWKKMSDEGRNWALNLPLSSYSKKVIEKAFSG